MDYVNPKITQSLLEEIRNQTSEIVEVEGVRIRTCRNVFPPRSDISRTSERLHTVFGDVRGLRVLDMGTGTGIQAIQAAKAGAMRVVAVDINPEAVACARGNVELNGVRATVTVLLSDLFESLPTDERFDVVIANLPITDFPVRGMVESALYDADYEIHKRFLTEVGEYLTSDGLIIMTHIDFKGDDDFPEFEDFVATYGYRVESFVETEHLGYAWRMYRIKSTQQPDLTSSNHI